jgi:hypothetical protein
MLFCANCLASFILAMDSTAFHFSSMVDWIAAIITPDRSLGIPLKDQHKFQIFASVACDILGSTRTKLSTRISLLMQDLCRFTSIKSLLSISKLGIPSLRFSWRLGHPLHQIGSRLILTLQFEIHSQLRLWSAVIQGVKFSICHHKSAHLILRMLAKLG